MPSYRVQFSDALGTSAEAALNAPSLPALAQRLAGEGCRLERVLPAEPSVRLPRYGRKISPGEVAHTYRQLALMLDNGVSPAIGVERQARETQNHTLRGLLLDVARSLREGGTLSHALAAYPRLFSAIHIRLLESGESSGRLQQVLRDLADHTERETQALLRIRTSLVYPQVVGLFTLAVMTGTLVFVQPGFVNLFRELGIKDEQLPLVTRALSFFGTTLFPWLTLVLFLGGGIAWLWSRRAQALAPRRWAYLRTRLPLIGVLWESFSLMRLSRLLAALLRGGVPLLEALRLAGQGAENPLLQAAMWDAIPRVASGDPLAAAFNHAGILPPTFIAQVGSAESGGEMEVAMERLAAWYSDRVDYLAARVGALIEPVFILLLAGIAAWIAMGVFAPLLVMIQSLSGLSN